MDYSWIFYAFLSALFAALTTILVKLGIKDVNSTLATAIRTIVVLVMSWAMVFISGEQKGIQNLTTNNLVFLGLSGITTGLSWLMYYQALKIGEVAKVVAIDKLSIVLVLIMAFVFIKEPATLKSIIGSVLITAGTFVMIL